MNGLVFAFSNSHINNFFWIFYVIDIIYQPFHCRIQVMVFVFYGADRKDCPISLNRRKLQLICYILQIHSRNISFISQHQHNSVLHIGVCYYFFKLFRCQIDSLLVRAVYYENQSSAFLEIMGPQISQFLLPTHIPN